MKPFWIIALICCYLIANGQTVKSDSTTHNPLLGVWGMFKDRHPDGWGSFNPPYEYLELLADNKFNRIYTLKKENAIFFGTYEIIKDSLIIFHESTGTNGLEAGPVEADTARLYSLQNGVLELWVDWQRILRKSIKKFGHKKKYRPLSEAERAKIEAVKTKLMQEYLLLKTKEEATGN